MLKLKARGKWYHIEGKSAMGVQIPRHAIGIAVLDKETLKAAELKRLELEKATEWPVRKQVIHFPAPQGLALIDAYKKWLAQKEEGTSTWKSYSSLKRFLIEPLDKQGVKLVKEVTAAHLNDLQNGWKNEGQTRNTIETWRKISSCLFNYCVRFHDRELSKNPWKPVPTIKEIKPTREEIMAGKRKDRGIATLPLDLDRTQTNWLKIQAHLPAFVRFELLGQKKAKSNPLFYHAGTFLGFLWLMYETGLRRSDTLIFRPDLIKDTRHGGSYFTVQVKTGDDVTCFLPQPLVDHLRALPLLEWRGTRELYRKVTGRDFIPGARLFPFYDGTCKDQENYMTNNLNKPLRELGRLIGISGSLRPHRFRDSFACNMLSLGLSLEDVQRMLGHRSIATTEKYYAPYVLGIQEAVENRQAAARQAALYAEAQQAFPQEVTVN